MTGLEMGLSTIAVATLGLVVATRRLIRNTSLTTERKRLRGFSVYDFQLTFRGQKSPQRPSAEAAFYFTLKTSPTPPSSAAKMLFDEKVRNLAE